MSSFEAQHASLCSRLKKISTDDNDYWSFRGSACREFSHGIFQYPAMMVPQLVRVLLDEILELRPDIRMIGDPFMGSGTVLTETKLRGLNFWGCDINPLAFLVCMVKRDTYLLSSLEEKIRLIKNISKCKAQDITVDFKGIDKWFRSDVKKDLQIIKSAIECEESVVARRFFWVALAETVKRNCNSRTSTFKLHIRKHDEIEKKQFNPLAFFIDTVKRNHILITKENDFLNHKKFAGHINHNIDINLSNIMNCTENSNCDLIITSPPYGDNATTIPYGQFSYLPLQWIKLSDIDESISNSILSTTRSIDSLSLGGHLSGASKVKQMLCEKSPTLKGYCKEIEKMPADRLSRVIAFFRDFDDALLPIVNVLKNNGIMAWVLGNRKVGGVSVPFDKILTELLLCYDVKYLCKVHRKIPTKRMAIKNNVTKTMSKESIIIFEK